MKTTFFLAFALGLIILSCTQNNPPEKNPYFKTFSTEEFEIFLDQVIASSQQNTEKFQDLIPFDKAMEDLQILKHSLEEATSSLYRYSSKSRIDSLFESFAKKKSDSVSYFQFTKNLALVFSELGCMHSGWGHSKSFKDYRNSSIKLLPLDFVIVDHELFLIKNGSRNDSLFLGTKILSINEQKSNDLISELEKYMVSDGHNSQIKKRSVSDYFAMAYSNFIGKPEEFKLVIENIGKIEEYTVKALLKSEIDSIKSKRYPSENKVFSKPLKMEVKEKDSVLIYKIGSFNNSILQHNQQNFIQFTDSIFEELDKRKLSRLIIDLRGNYGGWTANGKHLFSYFIDDSMAYMESVYSQKQGEFSFKKILASESPYNDTMKFQNGYWTNYPNLTAYPQAKSFKGKTMVLIDENSKSCSSVFAALMDDHKKASFMGSQCGGSKAGSNAMTISITLPNTQCGITFSTALYKTAIEHPSENGVVPDYPFTSDINSILLKKDTLLNFALQKITEPIPLNP